MIYTGIDYHKRYSVACTLDARGRKLREARIEGNAPDAFSDYFAALGEPSEVIIEVCWNWATLHDLLEETQGVARIVVSQPAKNRIIAEAQIKNDRIDAKALATLLRGEFMAKIHVPCRDVRERKPPALPPPWFRPLARPGSTGSRFTGANRVAGAVDRFENQQTAACPRTPVRAAIAAFAAGSGVIQSPDLPRQRTPMSRVICES
jgi:hypothetical protein